MNTPILDFEILLPEMEGVIQDGVSQPITNFEIISECKVAQQVLGDFESDAEEEPAYTYTRG